jgi:UDPglucose 6-dehydrogenase
VLVVDPEATQTAQRSFPTLSFADSVAEAVTDADAVLLLTEWPEFVGADAAGLAELAANPVVIDARNVLDSEVWSAAGWEVRPLGGRRIPAQRRVLAPTAVPA